MRQVKIRLEPKLYERIRKDAKDQKRSVSAQVAFIVENAVAQPAGAAR